MTKFENEKQLNRAFSKLIDSGNIFVYGDASKNNSKFVKKMEEDFQQRIKKVDDVRDQIVANREAKINDLYFEDILCEALGGKCDYNNPLFYENGELITSQTCDPEQLERLQSENLELRKQNTELRKVVMRNSARYVDPKHKKEIARANKFRSEMIEFFGQKNLFTIDSKGRFVTLEKYVRKFEG